MRLTPGSMPQNSEILRRSATLAGRSTVAIVVSIFAATLVRALINNGRHIDWRFVIDFSVVMGLGWFCVLFVYWFFKLRAQAPAVAVLDNISSDGSSAQTELSGFVAMEYFALILNRTYVIFIAPDGLYGWKAEGVVSGGSPSYFLPYAKMLNDPELMHDLDAVRKLAKLKGGFFIPRSEIISAQAVHSQKWGMSAIPHSGKILVRLASGGKREFIPLGYINSDRIQRSIAS
jgi:hypothetical protein